MTIVTFDFTNCYFYTFIINKNSCPHSDVNPRRCPHSADCFYFPSKTLKSVKKLHTTELRSNKAIS